MMHPSPCIADAPRPSAHPVHAVHHLKPLHCARARVRARAATTTQVLISLLGLLAAIVPLFGRLKALRILRVLRPLRLLQRNPGMKLIIGSLIKTLPSVVEVSAQRSSTRAQCPKIAWGVVRAHRWRHRPRRWSRRARGCAASHAHDLHRAPMPMHRCRRS